MIHGIGQYYNECKVLGIFGTKYSAAQHIKNHGSKPVPKEISQNRHENHAIINDVVDKILLD